MLEETTFAIELKYKTEILEIESENEVFLLKEQSAHDLGRFGYLVDIERLESLANNIKGYSILLTNAKGYWEEPKRLNTNDAAFRIHESAKINGELLWPNQALGENQYYEENTVFLKGIYTMNWEDYSSLGNAPSQQFRYLFHEIYKPKE